MDVCTLFFYLLCLCFDASAATSLITGKTSTQKQHTERARSLDSKVSPSLGSSWNAHISVLDVWILKRIYLRPKVGSTLNSNSPFGIN